MARPLRIEFPGALYHITPRGDRREPIYEDGEDRSLLLQTLAEVVECQRPSGFPHFRLLKIPHLLGFGGCLRPEKAGIRGDEMSNPKAQRRPPAPLIAAIAQAHPDRNAAVVAANATGGYSYRVIAEYFSMHLSTVGRIVRSRLLQGEK